MNYFLNFYQHLPEKIDPAAFYVGSFAVGWYALMYIAAFLVVYLLLRWRIRNKEFSIFNFQFSIKSQFTIYNLQNILDNFIFYSFLGVVIGGRLGYVIFYNLSDYLNKPWSIIYPFDAAGRFIGIYGMSYHGGLIGVILVTWYFVRKNKLNFWAWADWVVPAIPAGFFFGRIGNFLNGELYGRITTKAWGMYFPAGGAILRHPSQLYEAFFEGLVLFAIIWSVRNGIRYKNKILNVFPPQRDPAKAVACFMLYVFLYGLFRFFLEFFREPDPQIGLVIKWVGQGLTMGQILSLGMVFLSIATFLYQRNKKVYN